MSNGAGSDAVGSSPIPSAPPSTGVAARRGVKTVADMFRSLLVVIVGIGVLFGSIAFVAYRYHGKPKLQDVSQGAAGTFELARAQASFSLLAPPVEPAGWTMTGLSWDRGATGIPQVLHVSWVTPDEKYVELEESDHDVAPLMTDYAKGPQPSAPVIVGGRSWTVTTGTDGNQTWTAHEGGRWMGLTGGGTPAQLQIIAAGLH